jgi:hypothetical protein
MSGDRKRRIIGAIERVVVKGHLGKASVRAKIDTGAARTSVDLWLAARIGLGPTVDVAKVRSALVDEPRRRPVVTGEVVVGGLSFNVPVSIEDRSDMRHPVLIGMDVLRAGRFLIDPLRSRARKKKKRSQSGGS